MLNFNPNINLSPYELHILKILTKHSLNQISNIWQILASALMELFHA